mgnify:FL=1
MFKMKLTIPKVNSNWWKDSESQLTKVVDEYNRKSWSEQRDPVTNKSWAPRKQPTGSWPLLNKTGKMFGSTVIKPGGSPMTWNAKTTDYGPFLQYGTSKMVQRRWLGIGPKVIRPMEKIISKHIFKGHKTLSI